MKKKKRSIIYKRGVAFFTALGTLCACGTMTLAQYEGIVNNQLKISTTRIVEEKNAEAEDTAYYKSEYADAVLLSKSKDELTDAESTQIKEALSRLTNDEDAYVEYEMENSAVLLYNKEQALPLAEDERNVTMFGVTSRQPLYSCASGGGKNDDARVVDFLDAFKAKGFTVNETVYNAYEEPQMKQSFGGMVAQRAENEPGIEMFTEELDQSVKQTGGIGVVFLSREGGEGKDIVRQVTEADGTVRSGLALSNNEKELLDMVKNYKQNGDITKIIVIHNSPYAMELDWFEDYDVDAALHIGTIGLKGSLGMVDLLTGDANPSGKLVDTFAANSMSSPAVQTWYDQAFVNSETGEEASYVGGLPVANPGSEKYMVLSEGIYTGYKYYETRYEDAMLNRFKATSEVGSTDGNWDYAKEIVYPFGYGLSYTTFEQKLDDVTDFDKDTMTATVTVTNTGNVPGRSVVQIYAQTPYGEYEINHKVEKSAIQLVAFGKSDVLEPGASETLEIDIDKYLLASWDSTVHDGKGGYILSEGEYYIAVGNDAHDALNNVLAAKGVTGLVNANGDSVDGVVENVKKFSSDFDGETYKFSEATGARVENQFEDLDINYWLDDQDQVTYMTRSDWTTYPTEVPQIEATEEMVEVLAYKYTKDPDAKGVNESEFGIDAGLKMVDMRNVEWDDEETWNAFLHQMTIDELGIAIADSFGNKGVDSIAKPASINDDGPDGWNQKYVINGAQSTCYIGEATAACSFDEGMMKKRANYLAEDAMFCNLSQGWAPGGNLHRTPFSGRNHEYFSEDSNVNYLYIDSMVNVMINKGISVGGKHFAGNDVELNRSNISLFQTEQTWRQNSLRGFESSFTKGGATSTMNSKGGIGLRNNSEDYATQVKVLRDEWGFKGVVIADAGSGRGPEGIMSGTDMWCLFGEKYANEIIDSIRTNNDGDLLDAVLQANKRYYYAFSRSLVVNGLSSNAKIEQVTPWWKPVMIGIDCVVGVCFLAVLVVYIRELKKEKSMVIIEGDEKHVEK